MLIRQKFNNAGYPSPFTNSVIRDYVHKQKKRQQQVNENIIPSKFFELGKILTFDGTSMRTYIRNLNLQRI